MEESSIKKENKITSNNNSSKNGIVTFLIVMIILMAGALIYFVFIKKSDKPVDNTSQQTDKNSGVKLGKIDVYCKKDFSDCLLTTNSSEGGNLFHTIETETANPTVVEENTEIILFDDNGMKAFIKKDKSIKKINLENKYSDYMIVSSDGNLIGIVYKSDTTSGYYDYKTNKTLYDEGKLLNDAYNEKYIVYLSNNKISIYDRANSKVLKENINLENIYNDYRIITEVEVDKTGVSVDKKLVGIFAINESNGNSVYYSLEKNKTMYKNTYSYIYLDDYNDYLIGQKKINTGGNYDTIDYILDPTEEKIVFAPSNTKKHMSFHLEKYNGKYYFIESTDLVEPHYYTKGIIYSNSKKVIAEVPYYYGGYIGQDYMIDNQGELFIKKDNTVNKYNIDGELLDSKTYEKAINLTYEYIIAVNDGKLIIENSDFKQLAEVIKWESNYKFDHFIPQYISENALDSESNNNFVSGIYMVLEDGKNYTEYCFNPKNNKITSRKISDLDNYDLWIHWADLS